MIWAMPTPHHAALRALRMKYNAAYAAQQALAMKIADQLQDAEKKAAIELETIREQMRVAMIELAGHSAAD